MPDWGFRNEIGWLVPSGTDAFLDYHKTYIFDFENARQNDLELLTV